MYIHIYAYNRRRFYTTKTYSSKIIRKQNYDVNHSLRFVYPSPKKQFRLYFGKTKRSPYQKYTNFLCSLNHYSSNEITNNKITNNKFRVKIRDLRKRPKKKY